MFCLKFLLSAFYRETIGSESHYSNHFSLEFVFGIFKIFFSKSFQCLLILNSKPIDNRAIH